MAYPDNVAQLSNEQIGKLMRERKIPFAVNECIMNKQPLAMVESQVRCVRGEETIYCEECPFYPNRAWNLRTATVTGNIEFEGVVREMSDRQYMVTIPLSKVREAGLQKNSRVKVSIDVLQQ